MRVYAANIPASEETDGADDENYETHEQSDA